MLKTQSFLIKLGKMLRVYTVACAIIISLFSFSAKAGSSLMNGKCTYEQNNGTHNPASIKNCVFGMCAICEVNTGWDDWQHPQAEILYTPLQYTWTPSALTWDAGANPRVIGIGSTDDPSNCAWIVGVRFCVRTTKPHEHGNDTNQPQICGYEDPCDGMDPPDGNCVAHSHQSPFHEHESNAKALSLKQAATYGAMTGNIYGVALATLVSGIMGNYNHVVITNIGCVARKIGPIPYAWSNNAWFKNNTPIPTFSVDPSSTFTNPRVFVRRCTTSAGPISASTIQVPCDTEGAVTMGTQNIIDLKPNLNPQLPETDHNCTTDTCNYAACITLDTSGVAAALDDRKFCARITKNEPDKIIILMIQDNEETRIYPTDSNHPFKRPGYIPLPTVSVNPGSTNTFAKIDVTLEGQTATLTDDPANYANPPSNTPGFTANRSAVLHQVPFSIERPCVANSTPTIVTTQDNSTTPPTIQTFKTCSQYEDMVCIAGYTTAPLVAVYKDLSTTPTPPGYNHSIQGAPNTSHQRGSTFVNLNPAANPQGLDSSGNPNTAATITFPTFPGAYNTPVWVYGGTGADVDTPDYVTTSAIPATSTTPAYAAGATVPGHVGTQTIRPMTSSEAGLCICTPPSDHPMVYEYQESQSATNIYDYPVLSNCNEVTVEVWGAGAAGNHNGQWERDDWDNFWGGSNAWAATGAAGGYVKEKFTVVGNSPGGSNGDIIRIKLGKGGESGGESGGDTVVSHRRLTSPNNYITKGFVVAKGGANIGNSDDNGGNNNSGGGYSIPLSGSATYVNPTNSNDRITATSPFSNKSNANSLPFSRTGGASRNANSANTPVAGASVWLSDAGGAYGHVQPASDCDNGVPDGRNRAAYGAGGCALRNWRYHHGSPCSSTDCSTAWCHCDENPGSWGKGGHGRVKISCTGHATYSPNGCN